MSDARVTPRWKAKDDERQAEAQQRLDAAVSRISRVHARLHLLDRTPDEPDFPTELRLLREARELLDAEVKLA